MLAIHKVDLAEQAELQSKLNEEQKLILYGFCLGLKAGCSVSEIKIPHKIQEEKNV